MAIKVKRPYSLSHPECPHLNDTHRTGSCCDLVWRLLVKLKIVKGLYD
jgi:hypothetical protein